VRVWDLAAGGEPLVLKGHTNWVTSVAFSPDGRRLASGSMDRTVRLWDLAIGDELLALRGHKNWVTSVTFGPDGERLASGSLDHTVRVWEIGFRHLWRLRETTAVEALANWFAARFHLAQLGREELALQTAEVASALTSPHALGGAATLAALEQREGRSWLGEIWQRHYRACLELEDWAGAEDNFGRLRDSKADNSYYWHKRAWAMLVQARRQEMLQAVTQAAVCPPGQGPVPLAILLTLWPRGQADTSAFQRVCSAMAERFPAPKLTSTAVNLAWTRLLVGDELTESDTARLEKLARFALDSNTEDQGYLETYGAAIYRCGQVLHGAGKPNAAGPLFRNALVFLEAAVKKQGKGGSVWQQCFLAMTHHRLGNVEEARAWLTKAVRQIEQAKSPGWESRVEWYYLREEAERTLGWRVPRAKEGESS
jgi:tetratricopeptide (TPR) repeat protein